MFLIVTPYKINKDTSLIGSVVIEASRHSSPCSQKSPNNTSTQCSANSSYVTSSFLNIDANLPLEIGIMIFITYLAALRAGFKMSIYKPPKYLSKSN